MEQPTAPNLNHETYDVATAISLAQSYGALDSNPGATQMRKLVKIVKMMCDPDMEDHLDRASRNFCKIMFDLCQLIKGIKDDDADAAMRGLNLIAAVRSLFLMGIMVSMDCPVNEMFNTQFQRLQSAISRDAEAQAAWQELEAANGLLSQDEWCWDGQTKEWMPKLAPAPDSSDAEEEAAWLAQVAPKSGGCLCRRTKRGLLAPAQVAGMRLAVARAAGRVARRERSRRPCRRMRAVGRASRRVAFGLCLRPAPRSICECAWRSRR